VRKKKWAKGIDILLKVGGIQDLKYILLTHLMLVKLFFVFFCFFFFAYIGSIYLSIVKYNRNSRFLTSLRKK
jgi:hypothetical protein